MAKKSDIEWHVERRKLDDLKPHPDNPRIFTADGMKDLKKSIGSIGMAQPINITQDNVILSGHARWMALKEQGEKEVDVYVPNRTLTHKEEQETLIRMNANIAGEWDYAIAQNKFDSEDLVEWGFDMQWEDEPLSPDETNEQDEFDIEKHKVKVTFSYKDSHEIIDKFLREIKEKYPQLMFEVEIND